MNLRDSIGVALIGGFLLALGVLFWKAIPEANADLIVYMLGQLSGFAGGIVAYHYTLSRQTERAADAAVEAGKVQAQQPAGTPDDPVAVKEVQP